MQDNEMKIFSSIFLICVLGMSSFVCAEVAVNPAYPRQCYSCDGINCQRTAQLNVTSNCTDLLDICITIFEDYGVLAKGCYLDMPENYRQKCDGQNPECFKCFGQLCNNKGREDFKCIECNDNMKCDKDISAMTPIQCSIPTAPNSYCFVRKFNGGKIQRGCLVHMTEQMKCLNDKSCSMCLASDGVACNSYNVDMSAAISKASNLAISTSLGWISLLVTIVGLWR